MTTLAQEVENAASRVRALEEAVRWLIGSALDAREKELKARMGKDEDVLKLGALGKAVGIHFGDTCF